MAESTLSKLKVIHYILFGVYYVDYLLFSYLEVEPKDTNIETKIERMEMDTISGDYQSGQDQCSIRLVCKNARIKPGSCHFT